MKDYAKKTARHRDNKTSNTKWILIVIGMIALFCIGYAGHHYMHQWLQQKEKVAHVFSVQKPEVTLIKDQTSAQKSKTPPVQTSSQNNFYKILSNMSVPVPKSDQPKQLKKIKAGQTVSLY